MEMSSTSSDVGSEPNTTESPAPTTSQAEPAMPDSVYTFFAGMAAFTALVVVAVAVYGCIRIWCGRSTRKPAAATKALYPDMRALDDAGSKCSSPSAESWQPPSSVHSDCSTAGNNPVKFRRSQATAPETRVSVIYPSDLLSPTTPSPLSPAWTTDGLDGLNEQDRKINDYVIKQLDEQMMARFSQATVVEMGQTRL